MSYRRECLPFTLRLSVAFLVSLLWGTATSQGQEIWFGPGDDLAVQGAVGHPNYAKLFAADAPWKTGYERIDVFMLRAPWVLRTMSLNPAEVTQTIAFLTKHKIKIAAPMVGVATDDCGQGIEGSMGLRQMDVYPREMKRLGIALVYAEMDEPLYYGHYFHDNPNACQYSIAETAKRVAISQSIVRKYYPNVSFVMIEPPLDNPNAPAELVRFLKALEAAEGQLPTAFRFDVAWSRSHWQQSAPKYIRALNSLGIGYSFVSDAASGQIKDDHAWIESAKADTLAFERVVKQRPVEIVIQSWNANPVKLLPENDGYAGDPLQQRGTTVAPLGDGTCRARLRTCQRRAQWAPGRAERHR